MKAALDASPLAEPVGGIARYTVELHRALAKAFPDDEFYLQEPGRRLWWPWGLPRALRERGADVFHGTDFSVPYWPVCASVMSVHDLSPWRAEFRSQTSDRVRRRTPWLLRMGLATMVVTLTEAIRREAIDFFRLDPARVAAVHPAASDEFRPLGGPPGKHFLFVGTKGRRKNLEVVLEARRILGGELWIAGRGHESKESGVRILGAVNDSELPALYSGAAALLFPSSYEGFGLPIIEAMRCGTPVIASRDAAVVEVGGDAAIHAAANDPRAWAEAMQAVIAQREHWRESGLKRAAEFSWEKTARRMREVYVEAICRHGR